MNKLGGTHSLRNDESFKIQNLPSSWWIDQIYKIIKSLWTYPLLTKEDFDKKQIYLFSSGENPVI